MTKSYLKRKKKSIQFYLITKKNASTNLSEFPHDAYIPTYNIMPNDQSFHNPSE